MVSNGYYKECFLMVIGVNLQVLSKSYQFKFVNDASRVDFKLEKIKQQKDRLQCL